MSYRFAMLVVALAFISLSCRTPVAPVLIGNISGRVYLQSRTGQTDQDNHAISIVLTGNKSFTTSSADSGKFVLTDVEQGIYSLTYSKVGYLSKTIDNIQFLGNGTLKLSTVYLQPTDTLIDPPDPKNVDRRVYGYVRLYDENGDSLTDHGGVTVSINGTNLTATTEKSGIFYFEKYPKGDFDLTVSKNGFSNLLVPQVTFPDSTTFKGKKQLLFQLYSTIGLSKSANLNIQLDSVDYNVGTYAARDKFYYSMKVEISQDGTHDTLIYIYPRGKVTPTGYGKQVAVFTVIGDSPDVSIDNYNAKEGCNYNCGDPWLSNPDRLMNSYAGRVYYSTSSSSSTRWHIEHAGKEVYVRTYVRWKIPSTGTIHSFVDKRTNRLLTTGFTSSNVIKITLPSKIIIW